MRYRLVHEQMVAAAGLSSENLAKRHSLRADAGEPAQKREARAQKPQRPKVMVKTVKGTGCMNTGERRGQD
jgi:hypothetical protein